MIAPRRGTGRAIVAGLLLAALGCSARTPSAKGAATGGTSGRSTRTVAPVSPSVYSATLSARRHALIERGLRLDADDVGYYMDVQEASMRQAGRAALRLTRRGSSVILELPGPLTFESGSARLSAVAIAALSDVAKVLVDYRLTIISVEGHTDDSGDVASNRTLSETRAMAVARLLISKGVDAERLVVVGYGSERPVGDNTTEVGREANRRVVLRIDALQH